MSLLQPDIIMQDFCILQEHYEYPINDTLYQYVQKIIQIEKQKYADFHQEKRNVRRPINNSVRQHPHRKPQLFKGNGEEIEKKIRSALNKLSEPSYETIKRQIKQIIKFTEHEEPLRVFLKLITENITRQTNLQNVYMDLLVDIYNEQDSETQSKFKKFFEEYYADFKLYKPEDDLQDLFENEYEQFTKLKNLYCNKLSFADQLIHKDMLSFDLQSQIFTVMDDFVQHCQTYPLYVLASAVQQIVQLTPQRTDKLQYIQRVKDWDSENRSKIKHIKTKFMFMDIIDLQKKV